MNSIAEICRTFSRKVTMNTNHSLRRFGWLGLAGLAILVLLVAFTPTARAADFRGGDRVVIGANEIINDDLYVSANEIVIDGVIKGDVYAFGNLVTINGTVDYDVMAMGQTIIFNGNANGARLAGQNVVLGEKANVARTALLAGMNIETKPGSVIGSDLMFGAFQGLVAGNVGRDVVAGATGIEVRGTVGRNVRVSVGDAGDAGMSPTFFMPPSNITMPSVPFGLTIAPSAKIRGDLIYEATTQANIGQGAQISGPVSQMQPPVTERRPTAQELAQQRQAEQLNYWLDHGRRFLILLAFGLLALWLTPKWIQTLAEKIRAQPLGSLGRGALMVIGFFMALVVIGLLMVTLAIVFGLLTLGDLVGLSITAGIVAMGVLSFAYMVFASYIAPIVVSYLIGRLIFERLQGTWAQNRYLMFIVGLILLSLVALIPVLNFWAGLFVVLFALGALVLWLAPKLARQTPPALQAA